MTTRVHTGLVTDGGEALHRYRTEAGISQQGLAVALGVSVGMVSKWERGENVPRRDMAAAIDDHFDAAGELVRAFGYVKPSGDVAELRELVLEHAQEIADLWRRLEALGKEVAQMRGQTRRGGNGS